MLLKKILKISRRIHNQQQKRNECLVSYKTETSKNIMAQTSLSSKLIRVLRIMIRKVCSFQSSRFDIIFCRYAGTYKEAHIDGNTAQQV